MPARERADGEEPPPPPPPPSMAVAPPKRMRRGPWFLVGATAVREWPHLGPGASSALSQLASSTGRYTGAGTTHGFLVAAAIKLMN